MTKRQSTPVSVEAPPADGDADVRWRVRRRRRIIWGLSILVGIASCAWLMGVPSTLLQMQAQRQLDRGRPRVALAWLMWARKINGPSANLDFLTARTYRIQGDMNQTRSYLKSAWNLGFPVPRLQREETLALAQSGQFHEAGPALANLLIDPRGDMAEICEAYVTGYIRTYRLNQAEQLLTAWLTDSPRQPRALLLRGTMQIDLLNWKAAEDDLRKVLQAVPEHAVAADLLAGVLLKQKHPDEALKVLPVAVNDPQTRLSAQVRQVECYRLLGQDQAARGLLQTILKESPDSMQAHLDLGSLESDAGKFESAVVELEKARKLAPNSPDVRYALAIALRGAGRDAEAKSHFEFVTRAREAVDEVMNLRSKLNQNPADAELRCRIGSTLLDYGQTERGLVWLQSALDVDPRLTKAHQRLAQYYESRAKESDDFAKLAITHRKLSSTP